MQAALILYSEGRQTVSCTLDIGENRYHHPVEKVSSSLRRIHRWGNGSLPVSLLKLVFVPLFTSTQNQYQAFGRVPDYVEETAVAAALV